MIGSSPTPFVQNIFKNLSPFKSDWLLVEEVKQGEEIVLTDHNQPVARIVPPVIAGNGEHHAPLKAGCLKGFWMAPDFDEPLVEFKEYMA